MNDPYKILNVSPYATDGEVKQAYRALAKKYHPDRYRDSSLAESASEKMKEINEAYDDIMRSRKKGENTVSVNSDSHKDTYGSVSERYGELRILMNRGEYEKAEKILNAVPPTKKNAEWYYFAGTISYHNGWLEEAYNYLETACRMSPDNTEYIAFYEKISEQRHSNYSGYRKNNSFGCGRICCFY